MWRVRIACFPVVSIALVLSAFTWPAAGQGNPQDDGRVEVGKKNTNGVIRSVSVGRRLEWKVDTASRKLTGRRIESRRYSWGSTRKSDRKLRLRNLAKQLEERRSRLKKEWKKEQERQIRVAKDLLRKKKKRGY